MKKFYLNYIKPMFWFWIIISVGIITLITMNNNGYVMFSNNSNTFNNNGPGYHK